MQVFSFLLHFLLFFIVNDAKRTLKYSDDFKSDSKLPQESVQCRFRDESIDDFYQSEQTGNTYLFKNLENETDSKQKKNLTNLSGRMYLSNIEKLNIPQLLNSTDFLSELNQVNGSIDVLKALLNEYSSTMEGGDSRTESSNTDEFVGNYDSTSKMLIEENYTTTMSSFLLRLFSNKFNRTKVRSDQTNEEIDGIIKPVASNSSRGNQIRLNKEIVSPITVEPFKNLITVNKEPLAMKSSDKNQVISGEKDVFTMSKEIIPVNGTNVNRSISDYKTVLTTDKVQNDSSNTLLLNSLNENRTKSEEKAVSTTMKSTNLRYQLVVDEQDFKKFSQHILTSLENIEDGIILLAKENSIISEEIRSMENLQENYENNRAKEKNNFVELLKVLYDLYQNTSDNLISIQNMGKSNNNGLVNKNINHNMITEQTIIGDSQIMSYGSKMDNLNTTETSTTKRNEDEATKDLKYKIVIVGNNENKTLKILKNDSPELSNSNMSRKSFDSVVGNVIDVIRRGFPESHPIVVEYDFENNDRKSEMLPNIRKILYEV